MSTPSEAVNAATTAALNHIIPTSNDGESWRDPISGVPVLTPPKPATMAAGAGVLAGEEQQLRAQLTAHTLAAEALRQLLVDAGHITDAHTDAYAGATALIHTADKLRRVNGEWEQVMSDLIDGLAARNIPTALGGRYTGAALAAIDQARAEIDTAHRAAHARHVVQQQLWTTLRAAGANQADIRDALTWLAGQLDQARRERDDAQAEIDRLHNIAAHLADAETERDEALAEVERLREGWRLDANTIAATRNALADTLGARQSELTLPNAVRTLASERDEARAEAVRLRRAVAGTSLTMGEALALDEADRLRDGITTLADEARERTRVHGPNNAIPPHLWWLHNPAAIERRLRALVADQPTTPTLADVAPSWQTIAEALHTRYTDLCRAIAMLADATMRTAVSWLEHAPHCDEPAEHIHHDHGDYLTDLARSMLALVPDVPPGPPSATLPAETGPAVTPRPS